MSKMSELDAELREAGIDPEEVALDEDGGFIMLEGTPAHKFLMEYLANRPMPGH